MVQYRKSKKVGPFRLTVSQRGISTSVGAGPLRISRGADGKVRRTVRVPGTGIYDTKVVGGQSRSPASPSAQTNVVPNLFLQLGKLFVYLFVLGFILSVVTKNVAVGFGIVGGIFVALLVFMAVRLAPPVFQIAGRKETSVGPTRQRASDAHERADQPTPQRKRQPERAALEAEAEAEAAEAEAQAALARARAIRLRMETQGNAKPAASPQHSESSQGRPAPESPRKEAVAEPRNAPARARELRVDDRVQVVAPGDDYMKVGTVTRILDNGEVDVMSAS